MKFPFQSFRFPSCLFIFLFSIVSLPAAIPGYMKLGDIKGESQEPGHEGDIGLFEFGWAIKRSIPDGSTGAGRSRGGTTLGDVVITKYVDKSSPKLIEACGNGTFFGEVIITFEKVVNGALVEYLKITMTDVIVTSVSTGGTGDGDRLTENVSLNFTEAEVAYTSYKGDGSLEGIVTGTVQQSVVTP